jgi:hypothetical protein
MYNNKRGLSAIVATVLIILLVIAGVTLVWTPVRKLITEQSGELEASCLLANPQITSACIRTGNLEITVSNGAESEINDFQVTYGLTAGNLNETFTDGSGMGLNAVRTITVSPTAGVPTAARIAPIIGGDTCAAGSITSGIVACT